MSTHQEHELPAESEGTQREADSPSGCLDHSLATFAAQLDELSTFRSLFNGRTNSLGISRGGVATTEPGPVEQRHYHRHLASGGNDREWSLGINPLRDDNRVVFGALDFDAKDLSDQAAKAVVAQADELGLPLMWTRSRSGGLHAWFFLAEPADPKRVRRLLTVWGQQIGWRPKGSGDSKQQGDRFFEVFPKQEHIESDQPGSWIRLPWPGGDRAQRRRGMWMCDEAPTFKQWLAAGQRQRVTSDDLGRFESQLAMSPIATEPPSSAGDAEAIIPKGKTAQAPIRPVRKKLAALDDVEQWLSQLADFRREGYDEWVGVLMALHHEFAGTPNEQDAVAIAVHWSAQSGKHEEGDVERKWDSFKTVDSDRPQITIGSLQRWVREDTTSHVAQEVAELNKKYAHVMKGGNDILHTPPNGEPTFLDLRRWRQHLANRTVIVDGKSKSLPEVWLKHPGRRSFYTVEFDPTQPPLSAIASRQGAPGETDFNMWPGLAHSPSTDGSCELFIRHLRDTVCGSDESLYQWVIQWFADIVQNPERPIGTALVLRGPQGAGKTLIGEIIGHVLGRPLYTKLSRADELTGQFNGHVAYRLLVQVEEGFWAGDRRAESLLKHMITSGTIRVEHKFQEAVDLPNVGRLLITSNHLWVVPAGFDERRFAVLDVSGDRANDFEYFRALRRQMFDDGGSARLLHHLKQEVVIDPDLIRRPPRTVGLLENQIDNLEAEDQWLFDLLSSGTLPGDRKGEGRVTREALHQAYIGAMREIGRGRLMSRQKLGRHLRRRFGTLMWDERRSVSGGRPHGYHFATLAECRERFARNFARTPEWPEPHEWQSEDTLGGLLL